MLEFCGGTQCKVSSTAVILQQKIINYFEKLSLVYLNDKPTRTEKRMRQAGVLVGKSMQQ
tara:strand:+ start:113 stop:292 length:180 start_codon:yes stop_codon:yes gene_type:complete